MSFPSGLVTLVFTDIESSSELSEKHGALFEAARMEHFEILRTAAENFNGYEVETAGDALFLVFQKAADAVRFAVQAQLKMAAHSWPAAIGELRVRIGMHTGEPFIGNDKGRPTFRGPVTNKAARVQGAGHGGQILLSQSTYEAARSDLTRDGASEIFFVDCGLHRLKGVGEEHLWQACHANLRAEFPPLNTLNPQRHNLPQPALPLIGRQNEIAAWHEVLGQERTRLLTLTGFGGLGKTRSSLQLAELCVNDFAEGVWWVELEETTTAGAMIERLALALRLQPQAHLPLKQQLWNYLHERHLLLVLDNTEQNPQAGEVVSELLRETVQVKCLVTTRRALGLRAEILREVLPLPPAEAAQLFEEFARTRRADFAVRDENREDVNAICQRLEGVPLALELAASRMASLPLREVLRHLDQQFKVLQRRAPDLPPRQRALRGAIDWSFDLLSDDDKTLFAQLAVFHRGFTLEDAEAVCETFDLFEGVQELHAQSLLRLDYENTDDSARYAMLESVREYAAEKLAASADCALVQERHAAHFSEFAEKQMAALHTQDEVDALQRFSLQLENVRASLQWTQQKGKSDADANEAAALLGLHLGLFNQRRGLLNEAIAYIEGALHLPRLSPLLQARLLRERAGLHLDKNEPQQTLSLAQTALAQGQAIDDRRGIAEAFNLMGLAAKREGDFDTARQLLEKSLQQFTDLRDEIGIAIVQTNRGTIECEDKAGDKQEAAKFLEEALQLRRRLGDARGLAEVLNNLGVLAQNQEHWPQAEKFYRESLLFEKQLQNTVGVARVLYNLSEVAQAKNNPCGALHCALAAARLFEEAGSPLQRYAVDLCNDLESYCPPDLRPALELQAKTKNLDALTNWALENSS